MRAPCNRSALPETHASAKAWKLGGNLHLPEVRFIGETSRAFHERVLSYHVFGSHAIPIIPIKFAENPASNARLQTSANNVANEANGANGQGVETGLMTREDRNIISQDLVP